MSKETASPSERDMDVSIFSELLRPLSDQFNAVETLVFHDISGETIDYYSSKDPYATRIIAAHYGLIFESAKARLKWLALGTLARINIYGDHCDCVISPVGDDSYLTVIATPGTIDTDAFDASLCRIVENLREEAGY
ncbi:MAG: hypothetical protein QNJ97_06915 [Myxococcota bacterium]|nr:hypothetical protein [Myxococcota bacterium]